MHTGLNICTANEKTDHWTQWMELFMTLIGNLIYDGFNSDLLSFPFCSKRLSDWWMIHRQEAKVDVQTSHAKFSEGHPRTTNTRSKESEGDKVKVATTNHRLRINVARRDSQLIPQWRITVSHLRATLGNFRCQPLWQLSRTRASQRLDPTCPCIT